MYGRPNADLGINIDASADVEGNSVDITPPGDQGIDIDFSSPLDDNDISGIVPYAPQDMEMTEIPTVPDTATQPRWKPVRPPESLGATSTLVPDLLRDELYVLFSIPNRWSLPFAILSCLFLSFTSCSLCLMLRIHPSRGVNLETTAELLREINFFLTEHTSSHLSLSPRATSIGPDSDHGLRSHTYLSSTRCGH